MKHFLWPFSFILAAAVIGCGCVRQAGNTPAPVQPVAPNTRAGDDGAPEKAAAARRSIQAAYQSIDAAVARKDAATLLSLLAPDFQGTSNKGQKFNRSDMGRKMKLLFSTTKWLKAKTTIQKFSMTESKAIVTVTERAEVAGVNPQTREPMRLILNSTGEETWVQINGKWLKQRMKVLSTEQFVDGKSHKV